MWRWGCLRDAVPQASNLKGWGWLGLGVCLSDCAGGWRDVVVVQWLRLCVYLHLFVCLFENVFPSCCSLSVLSTCIPPSLRQGQQACSPIAGLRQSQQTGGFPACGRASTQLFVSVFVLLIVRPFCGRANRCFGTCGKASTFFCSFSFLN